MKKKTINVAIIVAVAAVLAVLLSSQSPKMTGQYANVKEYLMQQASNHKTAELAVWETPFVIVADKPVEVTVADRKLDYLEHREELDEVGSKGTLETWCYNWLIKIDPDDFDHVSVVLNARGMDENGYFCQTDGQFIIVLHYPDESYDVLGEISLLDAVDFLSRHNKSESIYDFFTMNDTGNCKP